MRKYQSIVASLSGMVEQLRKLADGNDERILKKGDKQLKIGQEIRGLVSERDQSLETAKRIGELIGE